MLLTVNQVKKDFADDIILSGVTFRIDRDERLALVGRNGCGKTTLLKIITGEVAPDSGTVQLAKGARIAYLRQESQIDENRTVLEEAQEGLKHLFEIKSRLQEIELLLESSSTAELLEEYSLLQEHFLESDGHSMDRDVQAVLKRLGFQEDEFNKSTLVLSGGERTRLALAKLLLEEPELLILDEPTNHLDLEATEFLENWVSNYRGSILLVSHDRTFLEATATRVLEMKDGQVTSYPGTFPQYLVLKSEAEIRRAEVAKRQSAEIAKMDEFVRRFMNSQRTAQARGRQKLMNRLIQSKVEAPKSERGLKAAISSQGRSGEIVVEATKASIGFPGAPLIKNLDWTVRYQERWGVIGENGAGKSTLVKALLGKNELTSGLIRLGSGVTAGYFAQDAVEFDLNQSPLDFMVWECDLSPIEARHLLARFLIEGDDVYRPIRTLSGGEKNKLSLAQLAVLKPNLLVLDEPTNHLDMDSRVALSKILADFTGSMILVSHDRWLLGETTDHILDIKKSGVVQYSGGYKEYRRWAESKDAKSNRPHKKSPVEHAKPVVPEVQISPRELSKEIDRLGKMISEVEKNISRDEARLSEIEDILSNSSATSDVLSLTYEHADLQDSLMNLMANWEGLNLKIEKLREQQTGKSLVGSEIK